MYFSVNVLVKREYSSSQYYKDAPTVFEHAKDFLEHSNGPFSAGGGTAFAFETVSRADLISAGAHDLAKGPADQLHLEYLVRAYMIIMNAF